MRVALGGVFLALIILCSSAWLPAPAAAREFTSVERLMQWTFTYRQRPEPTRMPEAVRAMFELGLLDDEDKSGYFVGFVAGVLAKNPKSAPSLIERMLPLPAKEQSIVVRAIAYSELANWPELLMRFAPRVPERQILVDELLAGNEPVLIDAPLDSDAVVYALWGFYVATGDERHVRRVISALAWTDGGEPGPFSWARIESTLGIGDAEEQQTLLERAVIASVAKWTLVSYAEHHRELVELYRAEAPLHAEPARTQLAEVLAASERFEADRVRKEEAARIEALKQRLARTGSYGSRTAYAGSVGIATACVVAGAVGHPEIAIPCVVTGALYSGAMKIFEW